MRELKFRVYDKTGGYYIAILDNDCFDIKQVARIILELGVLKHEYIIEQYTGIKDKNGKEIYEGDIVTFMVEVFDSVTLGFDSEEWHTAVVEWNQDDACYSFVDRDDPFSVQFEAEVIGNINENPELLDKEGE